MPKEAYQQWDMFTGEPVTIYGRIGQLSPRQMNLFPVNEIVQLGVSARPWLKEMPAPTLTLECQDVRTDEEKEHDLMREAEKLTTPLFVDISLPAVVIEPTPDTPSQPETETHEPQILLLDQPENRVVTDETTRLEDNENEQERIALRDVRPSKSEAYLALVSAAEERATTLYNTPVSELSETITMSQTKLDALLAGLIGAEIIAALTIGEFRGKAKWQPNLAEGIARTVTKVVDIDVPIAVAWVSKRALTTCRPDSTERIQALNEADMALIAEQVREMLDKTYKMVLDLALIAYLGLEELNDA